MAEQRQLNLPGFYNRIPAFVNFAGEAARAAGFNDQEVFHCQLAIDEACTNIIEHAYAGEEGGDIEIICSIESGTCIFTLIDKGPVQFEPQKITPYNQSEVADQIEPGGIGVHLIRQTMDSVQYKFSDKQNELTLIKYHHATTLPTDLEIEISEIEPDIWCIKPIGRLDSNLTGKLDTVLQEMFSNNIVNYVIDFSRVSYISSRGLKTLINARLSTHEANGKLALCNLSSRSLSVFEISGLDQVFMISDSCLNAIQHIVVKQ